MQALALQLLELARAEDPTVILRHRSVSLSQALSAAWQPWAGRAAQRGIGAAFAVPPELTAETDRTLLAVILDNLCGNAAEHAPEDSALRVQGNRMTDGVTLLFQNHAGELTATDLPHLFERFWRKDGVRGDGRHAGLGLSLAAEFVAVLGARLTARISAGEIEFALWLPAARVGTFNPRQTYTQNENKVLA